MSEWVREMPPPAWSLIPVLSQISSMCIISHAKICMVTSLLTQWICEGSWQNISALFELQAQLLPLQVSNSVLQAELLVQAHGFLRCMMRTGLCLLPRLLSPARGVGQTPQPSVLMPGRRCCSWNGWWGHQPSLPLAFSTQGKLELQGMFELGQLAQRSLLMRWCLQLTEKNLFSAGCRDLRLRAAQHLE